MRGRISALRVGCLLIAALPAVAVTQTTRSEQVSSDLGSRVSIASSKVTSDSADSYDARALRLETHKGEFRIVRGLDGPVVAKLGFFSRPDVVSLVAPSENAMREARNFSRDRGPGMAAAIAGLLITGVSLAASHASGSNWGLVTATTGGVVLMLYGGVRLDNAYSSLSKSIWWYNRDLKK